MQTTLQDLRYAFRSLVKAPAFALTAILTLALGIGANTAVFSIVNALLIRPLPYDQADRLVMLWQDLRERGGPQDEWATPGNFVDWGTRLPAIDGVAAIAGWRPTMTGLAEPESLQGEQVSHEYFGVLRVRPVLGRDLAAEDDGPNARRVAIIGHDLWQRRFSGSSSVVGQFVVLAGEPHEIVGVLPPGVRPIVTSTAEVWRPIRLNRATPSRGAVVLRTVARLADGVSHEQAQAAASQLATQRQTEFPNYNEKTGFIVQPLHDRVTGQIRPALLALAGAVLFVLLIACANVANLLMVRASGRGRELAVRAALGAGRGRMVRQLLTESLLVSVIGGAAGFVVGIWAMNVLVAMAPANAPRLDEVGLDRNVFAFAALLTVTTGLLFGLAPAIQSAKTDVGTTLKEGGRGTTGSGSRALRRALITAEVALALVLLTGGVLLVQTFAKLQSVDLGFRTDGVLVGWVNPPRVSYDTPEKYVTFYDQLLEKAAAIPGVQQAALTSILPLSAGDNDRDFRILGRPEPGSQSEGPVTWYRFVSAGYFDTIGMSLTRGRAFVDHEAAPTVVVNETFVSRYFPREDPLGRQLQFGPKSPAFEIVGVVADAKGRGAREETRVETFIPYWHDPGASMSVVLRGASPTSFAGPLREAVASLDRNLPLVGVRTMNEALGESISLPRFLATLAAALAALAIGLAALGIYGVMAYIVSQRTTEIGVRMAVGAGTFEVFRLVIGDGLKMAAAGVVLGVGGALLTARSLTTLLYGVAPTDPLLIGGTAALLVLVAAVASVVPAWRAMRVDPAIALRNE